MNRPKHGAAIQRGLMSIRELAVNVIMSASDEALAEVDRKKLEDMNKALNWIADMDTWRNRDRTDFGKEVQRG